MKRLFLLLTIIIGSMAAQAQTPDSANPKLLKFDAPITISLADKFGMQRAATFTGFFYNLETETLALRWRVYYFKSGQPVLLIGNGKGYEEKEQIADKHVFVDLTGSIIDTAGHPGPYMAEIDFYKMIAELGTGQQNATINQLIRQAGMRPGKWKE